MRVLTSPLALPSYVSVIDLACSTGLLCLLVVMSGGYTIRSYTIGRARQGRLEGGEGKLLGRPLMEAGYWLMGPIVKLLLAVGATPNAVTLGSLVPALGAAVAVATGHFGIAALLAIAAGLCDLLDGVLARHLGTTSDAGEVYDAAADRYTEFFFLGGLAVHYRSVWPLEVLALSAILASFMISYSTAKAEAMNLPPPKGMMRRAERTFYLLAGATFVPIFELLLPDHLRGRMGIHDITILIPLALVAVLGNFSAAMRFKKTARMAHERSKPAAAPAFDPGAPGPVPPSRAPAH